MGSPHSSKSATKAGPKSSGSRAIKRYRINPLELVIFTLVTAGFGVSVFHLFRESEDFKFATLQPMQTQPTRMVPGKGVSRAIAGAVDGVTPAANTLNFEVNCAENPGFQFGNQICPNEPNPGRVLRDSAKYNPAKID